MYHPKRRAIANVVDRPVTRIHARHLKTKAFYASQLAMHGSNLNTVPTEVLSLVLSQIPLMKLIPLRTVCKYWKSIIEAILLWQRTLKIRIHHKKFIWNCASYIPCSLKAIYAADDLEEYLLQKDKHYQDPSVLIIEVTYFNVALRKKLATLFPNITNLVLCSTLEYKPANVNKLAMMITAFPLTTELAIWTMMVGVPPAGGAIQKLCSTINTKLPNLKSLDLFIEDLYDHKRKVADSHLSIDLYQRLPKLTRFSLSCSVANLYDVLRHLDKNLSNVSINCQFLRAEGVHLTLANKQAMCDNVTTLRLTYVTNGDLVQEMCNHFRNIQSLQIAYVTIKQATLDDDLLQTLNTLPYLTSLRLHDYGLDPTIISVNTTITTLTIASFDLITRFTRVYCVSCKFDSDLFAATIARQFPSLRTLILMCWEPKSKLMEAQVLESLSKHLKTPLKCYLQFKTAEFEKFYKRFQTPG